MVVRKKEGSLNPHEKKIVKALLARKWRNQDIQNLINKGRKATINSARVTEVKQDPRIKLASDDEVDFYIKKKDSYDPKTGLNLYDDERLIRAREAMILAVQVFNSPGLYFKTEVFAVHANIAWTYLLHQHFLDKGIKIEDDNGRTLLLSQMIKRTDAPLTQGVKNNLQDMIDIRDEVVHKLLKRADAIFYTKFQTCCLNFDTVLSDLYGDRLSLKHDLSLALQFAKCDFEQIEELHKYDIPAHIQTLDARLNDRRTDAEKDDLDYQFRVVYTLQNASKSRAHLQFIKPGSEEGLEIHNILEKHVFADDYYPYKPKQVWEKVEEATCKRFTSHNHRQAMYKYKVRPPSASTQPENTNKDFCTYNKTYKGYTYSQKWIDFLIEQVNSDEYEKIKEFKVPRT